MVRMPGQAGSASQQWHAVAAAHRDMAAPARASKSTAWQSSGRTCATSAAVRSAARPGAAGAIRLPNSYPLRWGKPCEAA